MKATSSGMTAAPGMTSPGMPPPRGRQRPPPAPPRRRLTSRLPLAPFGLVRLPGRPGPARRRRCNPDACRHRKSGGVFPPRAQFGKLSWATLCLQIEIAFAIFLELAHPHRRLRIHPVTTHNLSKTLFLKNEPKLTLMEI